MEAGLYQVSISIGMSWNKYYQAPLSLEGLLSNLHGQKEFLSVIAEQPAQTLLEVGTGSGAMSIFFSWLGRTVTAIDLESDVISKAEQEAAHFHGQVAFAVADAFHLPYPDHSFDLAFHQGLLEHFADDQIHQLLNEQLRVAKQVVFSVPNQYYPRKDYGNERLMSRTQWENILSPYRILRSEYYSPKRFPKWYLFRPKIQYLAVITLKHE